MTALTPPAPIHNAIFTIPRTASNLLVRILNLANQPRILRHSSDGYLFLPTMRFKGENDMHSRFYSAWTPHERSGMTDVLDSCIAQWMRHVEEAERTGLGTCVKEHVNWTIRPNIEGNFIAAEGVGKDSGTEFVGNPTCIPDAFLRRLRPTLLIRHPALVVPSLLRTALDNEGREAMMEDVAEERMKREVSYRWHVALYRMFENEGFDSCEQGVKYPIVLDAADLGNEALMRRYTNGTGLDAEKLSFAWDVESAENMGSIEARMRDTLMQSQGVVAQKLGGSGLSDLDALEEEWKGEFGDKLGEIVARLVRGALPEYTWLWKKRLEI